MTLPPERISIKRRRQDEPVDTLILEPGTTRDKKRRFTDFYFQRLRLDHQATKVSRSSDIQPIGVSAALPNKVTRDYTILGIPTIKPSAPGDEVKDFVKYKAAQRKDASTGDESSNVTEFQNSLSPLDNYDAGVHRPQLATRRRFHLTRDISSLRGAHSATGIYRPKPSLRPPLATFIEQFPAPRVADQISYKRPPVDRIVELKNNNHVDLGDKHLSEDDIDGRIQIGTFRKTPSSLAGRHGNSIRDDPFSWDHNSDQLANELAALAFDIDPADADEPPQVEPAAATEALALSPLQSASETAMVVDSDDDSVFETYVRVRTSPTTTIFDDHHNLEVGILVIDDENEDLWERYVQGDDDDDEWNEEDEDSNAEDNPRNEYPDDELSTDDEYGRNVYRYRHNASDDEEVDE